MPTMQGMPGAMPGGGAPATGGGQAQGQAPPMGAMGQPQGPYGATYAFMAGQPLMPNKPTTVEEMQATASTLAQQAMQMPESQKDSFLIQLKKEDPTMHALVTSQLEEMRRSAELQGRDMVLQQQYGKQAAAIPNPVLSLIMRSRTEQQYGKQHRFIDLDSV